jgi:hypothetical protein
MAAGTKPTSAEVGFTQANLLIAKAMSLVFRPNFWVHGLSREVQEAYRLLTRSSVGD